MTAALGFTQAVTVDDMLRAAFGAIEAGADAVITARGYDMVRALAAESIPVVAHLGFVPRKSTWTGGVRAVGKTAAEAIALWDRFRRPRGRRRLRRRVRADSGRRHGGDQPADLARHDLAGFGRRRRRDVPFRVRYLRRVRRSARAMRARGEMWRASTERCGKRGSRRCPAFARRWRPASFPAAGEVADIPAGELAAFRARLATERET